MTTVENSKDQLKNNEQLKSIVYGDVVKNKYGAFRCFCATVSDESQIENIVTYLRKNISFHRLNKFSYSYRIARQTLANDSIIESYSNDARLEGCGEKILHLLQKFNVENVLLVVGVDKKDTFGILTPEYFHTIIERAKDLLSTLYEKVLENDQRSTYKEPFLTSLQEQEQPSIGMDSPQRQRLAPAVTYLDSNMVPEFQVKKKVERPNHFLSPEKRQQLKDQKGKLPAISNNKEKLLQSVLKNNLKRNFEKMKGILDEWQDNDYQHLKFICLYDKMPRIAKVFRMLMTLDDVRQIEDLAQSYDFKERLHALANTLLTREKCKKVSDVLRQDKFLTPKGLIRDNPVVASLLEYLIILVRNFELSERIFDLNVKESPDERKTPYDSQYGRLAFDIEEERNNIVLDLTKELAYSLRGPGKHNRSCEVSNTLVNTTESDHNSLPRVNNHQEGKTKPLDKEEKRQGHPISNTKAPPIAKKGTFVTKGVAQTQNSSYSSNNNNNNNSYTIAKHERYKTNNSVSISEDTEDYFEPRFGGQSPVETRMEPIQEHKQPPPRAPVRKNSNAASSQKEKSVVHEESPAPKIPISSIKEQQQQQQQQSGGTISSVSSKQTEVKSPKRSSPNVKALRESQLQDIGRAGFAEDIPDDPDEIRRYLDEHPIEGEPDVNLEVIVEKLTKHRLSNA